MRRQSSNSPAASVMATIQPTSRGVTEYGTAREPTWPDCCLGRNSNGSSTEGTIA